MADVKINDLAAAGAVSGTMQLETDTSGTTANKVTAAQIGTYVLSLSTTDVTWSGLVATIQANVVTDAKLRQGGACSVIGRSANSTGNVANISAGVNDRVFARSADTLAFQQVSTAMVADNAITPAKLDDGTALSLLGRSANSSGDRADIAAANDGEVMRRSGTSIGFGTVATAGHADDSITDGKLRNSTATSVIGRSVNSTGDPADIAASADGDVLRRSGTTLGFGAVAQASVTNLASDLAAKQPNVQFKDEGSNIGTSGGVTNVDFVGAGVTATHSAGTVTVTIPTGVYVTDGDKGDITVSSTGTVWTINNDVVTFAKMQNIATDRLLGRQSASSGDIEEISLGVGLDLDATTTLNLDFSEFTADTNLKYQDDSAVFWDASASAEKRILLKDMPIVGRRRYFWAYSDFMTSSNSINIVSIGSGTGFSNSITGASAALVTTNRPGVTASDTGTTTTGRAGYGFNSNTVLFGAGVWTYESAIYLSTLSDGTNTYTIIAGFEDNVTTGKGTDSAAFAYSNGLNSGKFQCYTRSNSTETTADSGVTVAVDTWYDLRIEVNSDATSVAFYIDEALVATIITNIPSGAADRAAGMCTGIYKSAGTTARILNIDFIQVVGEFTTDRA